jgi:hypothetical protein
LLATFIGASGRIAVSISTVFEKAVLNPKAFLDKI